MEIISLLFGGGFLWMLFLLFGCGILAATVAESKGRSGLVWFFFGLIFNILGLIAIAGMPSLLHAPNKKTHMRCPDCREFIYLDAKVCKCCGCKVGYPAVDKAKEVTARLPG